MSIGILSMRNASLVELSRENTALKDAGRRRGSRLWWKDPGIMVSNGSLFGDAMKRTSSCVRILTRHLRFPSFWHLCSREKLRG